MPREACVFFLFNRCFYLKYFSFLFQKKLFLQGITKPRKYFLFQYLTKQNSALAS